MKQSMLKTRRGWVLLLAASVMLLFFRVAVASPLTKIGTVGSGGNEYNLIFEGDLDGSGLVWLDFTRGAADWYSHMAWAAGLGFSTVTMDPAYTTSIDFTTGWRLPGTNESLVDDLSAGYGYSGPDGTGHYDYSWGYNMVNSELGNLFYISLGNNGLIATDGSTQTTYGLENTSEFNNLVETSGYSYWSGTEYSPSTNSKYYFNTQSGTQSYGYGGGNGFGIAVHSGEVFASTVQLPATLLLIGLGLAGLAGSSRKPTGEPCHRAFFGLFSRSLF